VVFAGKCKAELRAREDELRQLRARLAQLRHDECEPLRGQLEASHGIQGAMQVALQTAASENPRCEIVVRYGGRECRYVILGPAGEQQQAQLQVETLRGEIAELRAEIAAVERERDALREDVLQLQLDAKQRHFGFQQVLDALRDENAALRSANAAQCADLRTQLAQMTRAREALQNAHYGEEDRQEQDLLARLEQRGKEHHAERAARQRGSNTVSSAPRSPLAFEAGHQEGTVRAHAAAAGAATTSASGDDDGSQARQGSHRRRGRNEPPAGAGQRGRQQPANDAATGFFGGAWQTFWGMTGPSDAHDNDFAE
jgi:hypothetical protein